MENTRLVVEDAHLIIPMELWKATHEPDALKIFPGIDEGFSFVRAGLFERFKAVLKRALNIESTAVFYNLSRTDGSFAYFSCSEESQAPRLKSQKYDIMNYGKSIHLSPSDKATPWASREQAWARYEGYHEHRPFEQQDKSAIRCSQWFAGVCARFNPDSVLELGCGSGRNLFWLHRASTAARLSGIDVNPHAIEMARLQVGTFVDLSLGSLYDLSNYSDRSMDIVFTSGVLMHVPPEKLDDVIKEMHRIARSAVIHFELHGPSHTFDFHRYPRDYRKVYERLCLGTRSSYRVFRRWDFRSKGTRSFNHALLVSVKVDPAGSAGGVGHTS